MAELSTTDIANVAQRCIAACPVIVVGTGASIPYGIGGMEDLRIHLKDKLSNESIYTEHEIQKFLKNLETMNVEQALTEQNLSDDQEAAVIRLSWEKVKADDEKLFYNIASGKCHPHLAELFRHLFVSTHRELHVITTNYDRLAEYSANLAGASFTNGFAEGFLSGHTVVDEGRACRYACRYAERSRGVHVWKVHGSIDWYTNKNGSPLCLPSASRLIDGHTPLIVTPGTSKYEKTHLEPFRTVLAKSDGALAAAPSFLCVGYGFNDAHVHPKLTDRVLNHRVPLVILAKQLTQAVRTTLQRVTQSPYIAIEKGDTDPSSRVYTHTHPSGTEYPGVEWWDLSNLLNEFIVA